MKIHLRYVAIMVSFFCVLAGSSAQQQKKTGVLQADDLKAVVPTSFFFADQVAPVQMRNAVGVRTAAGKTMIAGLVDSSGYASNVAQKYQGFLITSTKLSIEGQTLPPGEYGFGYTNDGKFRVMDAGANDILTVSFHMDDKLQRPVPLKIVQNGSDFRLYQGKKYVTIGAQ